MAIPMLSKVKVENRHLDAGGRSMGKWTRPDGKVISVLLEWRDGTSTSVQQSLEVLARDRARSLPTDEDGDVDLADEVRTRRIEGMYHAPRIGSLAVQMPLQTRRTAVIYRCPGGQPPLSLRDIIAGLPMPSPQDRAQLACIIAAQVRSMHVHFERAHGALRPASFVFMGPRGVAVSPKTLPDLRTPYLLDWGRATTDSSVRLSMYQHPEQHPKKVYFSAASAGPAWPHDVWALMMILSVIAQWRLLDEDNGVVRPDDRDLLNRKAAYRATITTHTWQGPQTAKVFLFGFSFINRDHDVLKKLTRLDVKRFFDKLCQYLSTLAGTGF